MRSDAAAAIGRSIYGNTFDRLANPIALGSEIDESQPSERIPRRALNQKRKALCDEVESPEGQGRDTQVDR